MLSFCFPWYLDQSRYALEISLVHLTCCPFHLIGYQTVSYDNVALNDLEKSKGCNVYHNSNLTRLENGHYIQTDFNYVLKFQLS